MNCEPQHGDIFIWGLYLFLLIHGPSSLITSLSVLETFFLFNFILTNSIITEKYKK